MMFSVVAVAVAVVLLLVACKLCLRVGGTSRKFLLGPMFSVLDQKCRLTLELLGSNSSGSADPL